MRLGEGTLHAIANLLRGIDAVLAGQEVPAAAIDEADHREVPRWFLVLLQEHGVPSALVVVDEEGDELRFDALDEAGIAEDFGPEVATALSARHFLEEEKNRFASLGGEDEGSVVVASPLDGAQLDALLFSRLG